MMKKHEMRFRPNGELYSLAIVFIVLFFHNIIHLRCHVLAQNCLKLI